MLNISNSFLASPCAFGMFEMLDCWIIVWMRQRPLRILIVAQRVSIRPMFRDMLIEVVLNHFFIGL